ncbi:MAG: protein-methionine-sulfoxide reductase catalytic subunit MsrP [Pirellulales bacterium]|nr:protein-methionine-sulfoxide reductase catalytic subunit MsrP [Pirellulales bacterium]
MFIHRRNPLDPVGGTETPETVAMHRRKWLRAAGLSVAGIAATGAAGYAGWQWWRGDPADILARGAPTPAAPGKAPVAYPLRRDERFAYGRAETIEVEAARYTNFYEFSQFKSSWRLVEPFRTTPWELVIDGLCRTPRRMPIDDFLARYADAACERQYRHRCVERWAMAIPWSGVPLARVLKDVDPLPAARFVRFTSFFLPEQAGGFERMPEAPWPYTEGLTLDEAGNELTFLATGMYGHPLLKQHGAPIRLVVPWKYGYKSIKSIVRIELVAERPATFWSTLMPEAYPFESNVEPDVPRPWPQDTERMLGTNEEFVTQLFNGYGDYVAGLYRSNPSG